MIFLVDKIENNSPKTKRGGKNVICRFDWYLKQLGYDFELVSNYTQDFKERCFYIVDFTQMAFHKCLETIPESTTHLLQRYKIPVIIWFPTEAYTNDPWLIDTLEEFFHGSKIFLITANQIAPKKLKPRITHYFFPQIWYEYPKQVHARFQDTNLYNKEFIRQKEGTSTKKKRYDFLCFNGRYRPNRMALISEIVRNNLVDSNLVSCVGKGSSLKDEIFRIEEYLDDKEKQTHASHLVNIGYKKYLDTHDLNDDRTFNKSFYTNSFFSLVTETEASDDILTLSEKSFKPILNYHPFLIWGGRGSLQVLRDRGYETFPEIFDESYDNLPQKERLNSVVKNAIDFSKKDIKTKKRIFQQVTNKLVHNRNHFLSLNYEEEMVRTRQLIDNIIDDYQKTLKE